MFDWLKNTFMNRNRYRTHSRAVIVSCFYNPQNNPYRLIAFQKWFRSVRHLNFRVLECLIDGAKRQLPNHPSISTVETDSLLWHKETLINNVVKTLPDHFDYVFWVDADTLFTNLDWLPQSVEKLQDANLIQPFEWCVHLEKNQLTPDFDLDEAKKNIYSIRHNRLWRSFCASHPTYSNDRNYDTHGHVGFAWGAKRSVLQQCPLYDRALIGGSDHILAHAAVNHIHHPCILNSFTENITEVQTWMRQFYHAVNGLVAFTPGDLYHVWHGNIQNRQYLQRIRDFTPESKNITQRDHNGLHVAPKNSYLRQYYAQREDTGDPTFNTWVTTDKSKERFTLNFAEDMGYTLDEFLNLFPPPEPLTPEPLTPEPLTPQESLLPPTVPNINDLVPKSEIPENQNFS